jgi:hypothetical protein
MRVISASPAATAASFAFSSKPIRRSRIHHIVFTFPDGSDDVSPLSWNLTTGQLADILKRATNSDETKAMVGNGINWVNDVLLKRDDSEKYLCRASVERISLTPTK